VWTYDFLVQNGCHPNAQPLLTDFSIPYFSDAGISNITVPAPNNSALPSSLALSRFWGPGVRDGRVGPVARLI